MGKLILGLIFWSIAFMCYSQEKQDLVAVKNIVKKWAEKNKSFSNKKFTGLFATSTYQCSACCAAAANQTQETIETSGFDINFIVVAQVEAPHDGFNLRKEFKAKYFDEDPDNVLQHVFNVGLHGPEFLVISPEGKILLHRKDIQQRQITYPELKLIGLPEKTLPRIQPYKTIKLEESDNNFLVVPISIKINENERTLNCIDGGNNKFCSYDLTSGKAKFDCKLTKDMSKFFLNKEKKNKEVIEELEEHISLDAHLETVIDANSDSVKMLAEFLYDIRKEITGKGSRITKAKEVISIFKNGEYRIDTIRNYVDTPYVPMKYMEKYKNGFLSLCFNIMDGPDSLMEKYLFMAYSGYIPKLLLDYKTIGQYYNRKTWKQTAREFLSIGSNGSIFMLDTSNDVLCEINMENEQEPKITDIKCGGILLNYFTDKKNSKNRVCSMIQKNDKLFILMRSDSNLIIQIYSIKSGYESQKQISVRSKDEILKALAAGFIDEQIILMTKEKKNRWSLHFIKNKDVVK